MIKPDKQYKNVKRIGLLLTASLLLNGCAGILENRSAAWAVKRKGPSVPIFSMKTDLTSSLTCMDHLLYNLGYETMPVFVEDIYDDSGKLKVGSRNMMITALTKMSRRSKAYQVYTYGIKDTGNLISLFANAGRADPFLNIPALTIKGSITQFDKAIDLRQIGGSVGFSDVAVSKNKDGDEITLANQSTEYYVGFGGSSQSSLLGLDLVLIKSFDMTVVPGVFSNNAMALLKHGRNYELEAIVEKTGFNLRYAFDRADAESQSFRNLIDLAAIELTGRLYKLPYWTCLSVDAEEIEEVQQELVDWYYDIRDQENLVSYLKLHMAFMGKYEGELDNIPDEGFVAALAQYTNGSWTFEDHGITSGLFRAVINDFMKWYVTSVAAAEKEEKEQNNILYKSEYLKYEKKRKKK